jgi:hypothetical protein
MPTKNRRAVSIAGLTYARLRSCEPNASGYVERLIKADLDARGVPLADAPLPWKKHERSIDEDLDEHIGHHFTF